MKTSSIALVLLLFLPYIIHPQDSFDSTQNNLAENVKSETLRAWKAYKKYAWGADVLMPISKQSKNWYDETLSISPIDAYSTLYLMGFKQEAEEIEKYVIEKIDFNKDIYVKVFEVNIRILGGLLAMYQYSMNPQILEKAEDFADRILPAFNTPTGVPKYWVNLRTGKTKGDTVNLAEAGSYTLEMGILSYFTHKPKYYLAAKRATKAMYERRSELGLISDGIDVQTGELVWKNSHICAGADSYYEYLLKSYLLFGDEELGSIWNDCIKTIQKYLPEYYDNKLFYSRVNMETGVKNSSVITLYDAFFPSVLLLSGYEKEAAELQSTWDWLWNKYGAEPMIYDYKKETINYPVYDLNPEIIESAYYLFSHTGDSLYFRRNEKYWNDIKKYCKTDVAFASLEDVTTKEKRDYMPTFFFAETMKYLYLTFAGKEIGFNLNDYVFTTEAHPFKKTIFEPQKVKKYLGLN